MIGQTIELAEGESATCTIKNSFTSTTLSVEAGEIADGAVTLTITDTNDGAVPLHHNTITIASDPDDVELSYNGGTQLTEWTFEGGSSGGVNIIEEFIGGDDNNDGIMDPGETWTWEVIATLTDTTSFTVTGSGFTADEGGDEVTWDPTLCQEPEEGVICDSEEQKIIEIEVLTPEGCTPGYWKNASNHSWDDTVYSKNTEIGTIFAIDPDLVLKNGTLLGAVSLYDALSLKGGKGESGAAQILLRAAAAALLNADNGDVSYPMSTGAIIDAVDEVLENPNSSRQDILDVATMLDDYNNLGCSIDNHGRAKTTLVTTPSADGEEGTVELPDTATLSGQSAHHNDPMEGSIAFVLYRPADGDGCDVSQETWTVDVDNGAGDYLTNADKAAYLTVQGDAGVWHWTAVYTGDDFHAGSNSQCGEPVTVTENP